MRLRIYSPIRPLNFSLPLSFTACSSHSWPSHKLTASLSMSAISTRPITQNKRIQVRTHTPPPAVRSCSLLLTRKRVKVQKNATACGSSEWLIRVELAPRCYLPNWLEKYRSLESHLVRLRRALDYEISYKFALISIFTIA